MAVTVHPKTAVPPQQLRGWSCRMHLATHPAVQALVARELQQAGVVHPGSSSISGANGEKDGRQPQPITAAVLARLPYLSAVCQHHTWAVPLASGQSQLAVPDLVLLLPQSQAPGKGLPFRVIMDLRQMLGPKGAEALACTLDCPDHQPLMA